MKAACLGSLAAAEITIELMRQTRERHLARIGQTSQRPVCDLFIIQFARHLIYLVNNDM